MIAFKRFRFSLTQETTRTYFRHKTFGFVWASFPIFWNSFPNINSFECCYSPVLLLAVRVYNHSETIFLCQVSMKLRGCFEEELLRQTKSDWKQIVLQIKLHREQIEILASQSQTFCSNKLLAMNLNFCLSKVRSDGRCFHVSVRMPVLGEALQIVSRVLLNLSRIQVWFGETKCWWFWAAKLGE